MMNNPEAERRDAEVLVKKLEPPEKNGIKWNAAPAMNDTAPKVNEG